MGLIRRIKDIVTPSTTRPQIYECMACGYTFKVEPNTSEDKISCPECHSHDVRSTDYNPIGRWVG